MNNLLNGLKNETNFAFTENGALTHRSTLNAVYDLFALGGAYRYRSDEDVLVLFSKAVNENPLYALKCLFYLRDIRGGIGERRFFRVCMEWLARNCPEAVKKNIRNFPEYGRWDDLYTLIGTPCEKDALEFMKEQFLLDMDCRTPSLLGKWLPSENSSSKKTKEMAKITIEYFNLTPRSYRKALSTLRSRINIVEKLMSQNRWDEIEFDKLPSKAGLRYRNAFARNDFTKERYLAFIANKNNKVNAGTLYPYEVVEKAVHYSNSDFYHNPLDIERLAINKYWENLTDYFNGASLNALAMVDTSGSMRGTPINVAISLGLYCAEHAKGPFANHYISFSSRPQLIECVGYDFVDKVQRIYRTNLCSNTNLKAAFDMLLETAKKNHLSQNDMPEKIIVISDMDIDCMSYGAPPKKTDMEMLREHWEANGYKMPSLVYWNVNARNDNILDDGPNITYVSGCSPVIFDCIMSGKTGIDVMWDKLESERYQKVVF